MDNGRDIDIVERLIDEYGPEDILNAIANLLEVKAEHSLQYADTHENSPSVRYMMRSAAACRAACSRIFNITRETGHCMSGPKTGSLYG